MEDLNILDKLKHQLDENLVNLLKEKRFLIHFLDYLDNNKIDYQILEHLKNSYLILRVETLDPKIFIVLLNRNDIKNALINYENLIFFQNKVKNENNQTPKLYLIFLDPSINNIEEVQSKALFADFKQISLESEFQRIKETNIKVSIKKNLRKGLPLGNYNVKNKLNDLTGKEWIKFTKSWFIHNPPPRNKLEILHPAKFPETLLEDFIKFFTKEDGLVIDPFLGTGSTAVAAKNTSRKCIGFEINSKYAEISKLRLSQKKIDKWIESKTKNNQYKVFNEDSNNIDILWKKHNIPLADFCITSPPYWNQLKRNFMRQKERKNLGLDTKYSENPKDIGNIDNYRAFILAQKSIFDKVYNVLKNMAYLVVITNNVFYSGRVYPLAFDTAISLSDKWVLKDEKIWCQDDKSLLPLGINSAWVANRCHQYCLIFRKEQN
jgi:DNA modification methylase